MLLGDVQKSSFVIDRFNHVFNPIVQDIYQNVKNAQNYLFPSCLLMCVCHCALEGWCGYLLMLDML